jgi:hypothetical protein
MKVGALQEESSSVGAHEARLKPFVLAGVGATFLSAEDLESETSSRGPWAAGCNGSRRSAWSARAGPLRADPAQRRFSDICDPFGFCQGSLHQFEFLGGVVLRF